MTDINRNAEICQLYTAGMTVTECSSKFKICNERVRQILRKAGVFKRFVPKEISDRGEFLGVNVTEPTKEALRQEAVRRGVSMSELSSNTIEEMLRQAKP
jgi:hypothetical protein